VGARPRITFRPLVPGRLADLERLFGPRGACAGCWCAWWKTTRPEFERGKGEGNREAMRRQVRDGLVPGLLAYDAEGPVGWCAVEPRSAYTRLARSRSLAPVDDEPVWSVTCFFVARRARHTGLTQALLAAAAAHARRSGASILEGYPVDPRGATADAWLYTGLASTFAREGFVEVARRSPTRPIVRKPLRARARRAPAARARAPGRSRAGSSPSRPSGARRGR
jgi:GNAT superfamily N-acetyltransferase